MAVARPLKPRGGPDGRRPLSGAELNQATRIHEASLLLLENPGIRIEHEDLYNDLIRRGARPGRSALVARIPRAMAGDYLALCPPAVTLTDRKGSPTVLTSHSEPVFWSAPGLNLYQNGEHRRFRSEDMACWARLLDHLPSVHAVFGVALDDVPPPARDVAGLRTMAKNSSKHLRVLFFSPDSAEVLLDMKQVVGPHPWFSIGFTAHGPLRWTRLALDVFRRTAGHGIPATINGEPMAGASAPVTLAGTAAVGNAEILAGLVVNQMLEPGRPCIYNFGLAHVFDMKTAIAVTGGPENALLAHLSALMGRFYDLPSASWVSTEAMSPDSQAALEKTFGFQAHAASGMSCIWGVGQLESELTLSPAQAVIDDEIIAYTRRYRRGVPVDAETLALEVTQSVGIAGCFLDHEHTLAHFRQELFEPRLLYRKRRDAWNAEGSKSLSERAEKRAEELMRLPVETELTGDQVKALDHLSERYLMKQKSQGG
ncbi:MAG: trimethylamine methyltransferase family protein [Planctomycetes bacterium]|nr:trimethylamine methyltransferase family protein [Planctomycetota bacterium]